MYIERVCGMKKNEDAKVNEIGIENVVQDLQIAFPSGRVRREFARCQN